MSRRAEPGQNPSCRTTQSSDTFSHLYNTHNCSSLNFRSVSLTWLEMHCWCLGGPSHDTGSRPSGPGSLPLTGHPGNLLSVRSKANILTHPLSRVNHSFHSLFILFILSILYQLFTHFGSGANSDHWFIKYGCSLHNTTHRFLKSCCEAQGEAPGRRHVGSV